MTKFTGYGVLVPLVVCACSFAGRTGILEQGGGDSPPPPVAEDAALADTAHNPVEGPSRRMARLVPGFGGAFVDEDGVFNVWLTDLSAAPQAINEVLRALRRRGRTGGTFRYIEAQYSYRDLEMFYGRMRPYLAHPGIARVGIDEINNKLRIGVVSDEIHARVEIGICTLGLPRNAFIVEHAEYAQVRGDRRRDGTAENGDRSRDSLWPPPLVVEHDAPDEIRLILGDSLYVQPALANRGARAITVTHGTRVFVLEMHACRPMRQPESDRITFPPHASWGPVHHLEYPNPASVYTLPVHVLTLQAGERRTPLPVYAVPFDSVGEHSVRVCANVDRIRVCSPRRIRVVVTPRP